MAGIHAALGSPRWYYVAAPPAAAVVAAAAPPAAAALVASAASAVAAAGTSPPPEWAPASTGKREEQLSVCQTYMEQTNHPLWQKTTGTFPLWAPQQSGDSPLPGVRICGPEPTRTHVCMCAQVEQVWTFYLRQVNCTQPGDHQSHQRNRGAHAFMRRNSSFGYSYESGLPYLGRHVKSLLKLLGRLGRIWHT